MDSREPREDHELAECWTCRERNFCEITHSSNDHPGKLFRCINCKAVYPDFALRRPSPVAESAPTDATAVEAERDDTEARRLYNESTANDPYIHCNRFPTWSELTEETRDYWRTPKES